MSKTAREVIAEQRVHGVEVAYRAEYFVKALDAAGFVIVPKEPTESQLVAMIEKAPSVEAIHIFWKDGREIDMEAIRSEFQKDSLDEFRDQYRTVIAKAQEQ